MPVDAEREGDWFNVYFDVPGVDPDPIELTVERNLLQVKAQRQRQSKDSVEAVISERPMGVFLDVAVDGTTITVRGHRGAPHLPEATRVTGQRPYGHIDRRTQLDEPATGHGITATYTDGVLTLTIPTAGARARHVHDQRSPAHVLHAIN
jgi:HSP20 family molecular chaperone IbpA